MKHVKTGEKSSSEPNLSLNTQTYICKLQPTTIIIIMTNRKFGSTVAELFQTSM